MHAAHLEQDMNPDPTLDDVENRVSWSGAFNASLPATKEEDAGAKGYVIAGPGSALGKCKDCGSEGEVLSRKDFNYWPEGRMANVNLRCTGCGKEGLVQVCQLCDGRLERKKSGLNSCRFLCTRCGHDHYGNWD